MSKRKTDYYRITWEDLLREKDKFSNAKAAFEEALRLKQQSLNPIIEYAPDFGYRVRGG